MLQQLLLQYNSLTGQLPASWGANGSLPQLTTLELGGNSLSGTLPGWGVNSTSSLSVLTVRLPLCLVPASCSSECRLQV